MIYGIGTDLVDIARIERVRQRRGEAFARKILDAEEYRQYRERPSAAFLAKRFAAKEAFAKALRCGLRPPLRFADIAVSHETAGAPLFRLSPHLSARLRELGVSRVHLSLSDEQDYALAFAVAEYD